MRSQFLRWLDRLYNSGSSSGISDGGTGGGYKEKEKGESIRTEVRFPSK